MIRDVDKSHRGCNILYYLKICICLVEEEIRGSYCKLLNREPHKMSKTLLCFLSLLLLTANGQDEEDKVQDSQLELIVNRPEPIPMDTVVSVEIGLRYSGPMVIPSYDVNLTFTYADPEAYASQILTESLSFTNRDIARGIKKDLMVEGVLLGLDCIEVISTLLVL